MAFCSGRAWLLSTLTLCPRPELQTGTTLTLPAKASTILTGIFTSVPSAALQVSVNWAIWSSTGGVGRSPPSPGPPLSGGVLDVVVGGGGGTLLDWAMADDADSTRESEMAATAVTA